VVAVHGCSSEWTVRGRDPGLDAVPQVDRNFTQLRRAEASTYMVTTNCPLYRLLLRYCIEQTGRNSGTEEVEQCIRDCISWMFLYYNFWCIFQTFRTCNLLLTLKWLLVDAYTGHFVGRHWTISMATYKMPMFIFYYYSWAARRTRRTFFQAKIAKSLILGN